MKNHTRSFKVMRINGTIMAAGGLMIIVFSGLPISALLGGGLLLLIGILAIAFAGPVERWERRHNGKAEKVPPTSEP